MKQVRELFHASISFFEGKGIAQPRRSVEDLLAAVLAVKRMDVYLLFDRPVEPKEIDLLRSYVRRRASGEPVEYIIGSVDFFGMPIQVSKDVLIPRPETELLIPLIQKQYRDEPPRRILDMCTGSGCLAIALKKAFPTADVVAVDISSEALSLAKSNSEKNGLDITFCSGDMFEPIDGLSFDLIVSNPPYISDDEYEQLDPSVSRFEPRLALVAGNEGLAFYQRFASDSRRVCSDNAKLFFEIGYSQGKVVPQLFQDSCWINHHVEQDWSGKDRFFFLEYASETL